MGLKSDILTITNTYLEDKIDYFKLLKASKDYRVILEKISKQNLNINEGRTDIMFENGKALGTFWAGLCIDDIIRTRQFIRGVNKVVKEKIDTKKKQLHILYAGTGPYATLILPTILTYPKEDIKYTFLEVNPLSFSLLKKMVFTLGIENYDITFLKEDATKYKIKPKDKPDIIVSETMQNSLDKEQQVPIYLNLMNQVEKDTIFIPEKITLYFALKKANIPIEKLDPKKHYLKTEKILEISKDLIDSLKKTNKNITEQRILGNKKTIINQEDLKDRDVLAIITEIQVYKEEQIIVNQSGLTTPKIIANIPEDSKGEMLLESKYIISSVPKLDYKISYSS